MSEEGNSRGETILTSLCVCIPFCVYTVGICRDGVYRTRPCACYPTAAARSSSLLHVQVQWGDIADGTNFDRTMVRRYRGAL